MKTITIDNKDYKVVDTVAEEIVQALIKSGEVKETESRDGAQAIKYLKIVEQ